MRSFRPALLILLASAMYSAPAAAQTPAVVFAPATGSYRQVTTIESWQELMGRDVEFRVEQFQLFRMDVVRGGRDTLRLNITIDSATTTMSSNIMNTPPRVQSGMKGQKLTATMTALGEPLGAGRGEAGAGRELLRHVLVELPPNARVGTRWNDTIPVFVEGGGSGPAITAYRIRRMRVVGDTTWSGERAWKIERLWETQLRAAASEGGVDARLRGRGEGSGMLYISAAGRFLGSIESEEAEGEGSVGEMRVPMGFTITNRIMLVR